MKTSNPYGADDKFKTPPETVEAERRQASGKAKARFPHRPLSPSTKSGEQGKVKTRALTPGGPSGS
jgi:hypothetical protein